MSAEAPPEFPSLAALDRALGLRGRFFEFVVMAWPHIEESELHGRHIEIVCNRLEALGKGDIRNLVINIPPGTGKSTITCVLWPIWLWLREPRASVLTLSVSHDIVLSTSSKGLALIRSDWFQKRWGDLVAVGPSAGVLRYDTIQGGHREATTFGGQIIGKHPDIIVIDDPLKSNDISPSTLADVERTWRTALSSRGVGRPMLRRACIMQRLHVKDLAGVFIESGWDALRLPMRFEAAHADPFDFRTVDGELLVPSMFPENKLRDQETNWGPRTTAAQYQQRPFPEGGAIFLEAWFRTAPKPQKLTKVVQSWDLTFKGGHDSDFVAGHVWGFVNGEYWLLDRVHDRLGFTATIERIVQMRTKWPQAMEILIEDKANGPAVIETLQKQLPGIIPVAPSGSKEARAHAVTPLFASGCVYFANESWADEVKAELLSFPNGAHDDDVDACTQALGHLYGKTYNYAAAMAGLDRL